MIRPTGICTITFSIPQGNDDVFCSFVSDIGSKVYSWWGDFVSVSSILGSTWCHKLHFTCFVQMLDAAFDRFFFLLSHKSRIWAFFCSAHISNCVYFFIREMIFEQPFETLLFSHLQLLTGPCFKRSEVTYRLHRKITSDAIKRLLFFVFDNKAMFGYFFFFFFFFLDNKRLWWYFQQLNQTLGEKMFHGEAILCLWNYTCCTMHRCCFWRSPWEPLHSSVWEKANPSLLLFIPISNRVWGPSFCSPFFHFGLIFVCFRPSQI